MEITTKRIKVKNVKDKDGTKGVFIPSADWKAFKKELEALKKNLAEKLPRKEKPSVYKDVKEALQEVALIRQGKVKPKDIKDLLSEL
ncbi:MAG: hypothetical protein ACKVOQ_08525 [Cyclobacteriaceae bacterium]